MEVGYSFATIRTVVDYDSEAVLEIELACEFPSLEEEVSESGLIFFGAFPTRGMGLRGIIRRCVGA